MAFEWSSNYFRFISGWDWSDTRSVIPGEEPTVQSKKGILKHFLLPALVTNPPAYLCLGIICLIHRSRRNKENLTWQYFQIHFYKTLKSQRAAPWFHPYGGDLERGEAKPASSSHHTLHWETCEWKVKLSFPNTKYQIPPATIHYTEKHVSTFIK